MPERIIEYTVKSDRKDKDHFSGLWQAKVQSLLDGGATKVDVISNGPFHMTLKARFEHRDPPKEDPPLPPPPPVTATVGTSHLTWRPQGTYPCPPGPKELWARIRRLEKLVGKLYHADLSESPPPEK